ncbi:putative ABC transport system ATP-binding protein [Paenibacillus cellulosilyticus]|uniref:Putative ABC transport system ATP-binding protein n=1 Tax=Paenibacillus cellulosilyticus TaxID=375489 RepID=A0A2V2Z8G3_9BACL|nr:ABC transporter ATP-binding protein [Paenibacillus cellulosilyticus]PWW08391.1 putative ABC transport system ATP-binding protein [Paenibacillus cellulosilyticus]
MSHNDNEVLIEIEKLVKTYRMGQETVQVLHDVNLTVNKGDFLAIVGPSGSGKSTMMNIIGCLDIPTSGSYKLDGVEVKGLSDNKLAAIRNDKIGFIFQGFQLLPKLTAIENVELPLVYRGMSNKDRRKMATEALRLVGLEERMFHKPSELSGGQQQRVAIARALAGQPPMLLADEPTGALDTRTGQEVLALIEQLHRQGHTIVLITHDMEVAARAERVVRMKDGVLTEERAERRERREAFAGIPDGV